MHFTFTFRKFCLDPFSAAIDLRTFSSRICNANVKLQMEIRKIRHFRLRSPKYTELSYFTLSFWRGQQRNLPRFITHVQSHCSAHWNFCLVPFSMPLLSWFWWPLYNTFNLSFENLELHQDNARRLFSLFSATVRKKITNVQIHAQILGLAKSFQHKPTLIIQKTFKVQTGQNLNKGMNSSAQGLQWSCFSPLLPSTSLRSIWFTITGICTN